MRYKTLVVNTNSKHIDFEKSKSKNRLCNPQTRAAKQAKKDAYFMRCYYGYRECIAQGGQVFFYTLTYTQKNLPHFFGVPCFSYDDISWMMKSNGFAKSLQRNWGSALKYALFCEYGDEKNRPHYHVLFYLFPFRNKKGELSAKYPYKKIDPISFRSLVKHYWQGDMFRYEDSIKGIVKEGSINNGLVKDFKAIQYCTKYSVKQVSNEAAELQIKNNIQANLFDALYQDEHYYIGFLASLLNHYSSPFQTVVENTSLTNTNEDLRALHKAWLSTSSEHTMDEMSLDYCIKHRATDFKRWLVYDEAARAALDETYRHYIFSHLHDETEEVYKEYLYHYGPRPRLSHKLGLSVLDEIDPYNPTVWLPSGKKMREVPISLYYYRKLFKEVVCDENTDFKVKYIDNELAIEVKKARLNDRIEKTAEQFKNVALKYLAANESTRDKIKYSYVKPSDKPCIYRYGSIDEMFEDVGLKFNNPVVMAAPIDKGVFYDMAVYHNVYRDRYVKKDAHDNFPPLDIVSDYERFLYPEYYYIEFSDPTEKRKELKDVEDEQHIDLYDNHPDFKYFQKFFEFLELADDKLTELKDKEDDAKDKLRETIKKFHTLGYNFGIYDLEK